MKRINRLWKDGPESACGLDPCPFCGGEGMRDITPWDGKIDQQYFVRCRSCAATGGWAKNPRGAVRWWNMRADAALGEGLTTLPPASPSAPR